MSEIWSPHPRGMYTVMLDGVPRGLGAREEFEGRPGLWNMFWLHSVKVDWLLNWELPPEEAPMHTDALSKCVQSADFDCGGVSFEDLCESLKADKLIAVMVERDFQPPIRVFWDSSEYGWESLVNSRLKTFKSVNKSRGVVIKGNFPLNKNRR